MRRVIRFFTFVCSIAVIGALGCSGDDDAVTNGGDTSSAEARIGPEGGAIEIAGRARLVIPAGAVSDTLDFRMVINDTIAPPYVDWGFLSPVFTIEPSPLTFDSAATLTIWYDPSKLGAADESGITIYTYNGLNWHDLTTALNIADDRAEAVVYHLSDFAAMTDTSSPVVEGVYAKLIVGRQVINMGYGEPMRIDAIEAVFDSAYAPCDPIHPIGSVTVSCNQYSLVYDAETYTHRYPENPSPVAPFIVPGGSYAFTVTGDVRVPALTESVAFPVYEPYLTYPDMLDTASLQGFDILWQGGLGGVVELVMMSGESQVLFVETDNDGSYSVSSSQLAGLSPGMYSIILSHYERRTILRTGYDSRSFIAGRVMSTGMFQLQ